MKKTFFIWTVIVLLVLKIIFDVGTFVTVLAFYEASNITSLLLSTDSLILVLEIVLTIILLAKLVKNSSRSMVWTHIVFGYSILHYLYGLFVVRINGEIVGYNLLNYILPLITIIIWITFIKHLKKLHSK